jgi:hypothetical protein
MQSVCRPAARRSADNHVREREKAEIALQRLGFANLHTLVYLSDVPTEAGERKNSDLISVQNFALLVCSVQATLRTTRKTRRAFA